VTFRRPLLPLSQTASSDDCHPALCPKCREAQEALGIVSPEEAEDDGPAVNDPQRRALAAWDQGGMRRYRCAVCRDTWWERVDEAEEEA
jgi:hypothetical protein